MKIKSITKVTKEVTYDLNIKNVHNYFVSESDLLVHNSGKDLTKVDRSGAYAARRIAKSIVASGLGHEAIVQLSYAIGVSKPFSVTIEVDKFNLPQDSVDQILEHFDLTPSGILRELELLDYPLYPTSVAGHFMDNSFPWESKLVQL